MATRGTISGRWNAMASNTIEVEVETQMGGKVRLIMGNGDILAEGYIDEEGYLRTDDLRPANYSASFRKPESGPDDNWGVEEEFWLGERKPIEEPSTERVYNFLQE